VSEPYYADDAVRFKKRHPTEKHLDVVAELVRECTPAGAVVLDPTAGVCTTGEAARLTGRRAVLIEREERYCEIGATRLARLAEEAA
jgi:site-specific DNA-methyltransferase (adenine-specific)